MTEDQIIHTAIVGGVLALFGLTRKSRNVLLTCSKIAILGVLGFYVVWLIAGGS